MRRTNLRYSPERVLGDWPWKAMKTSCATSSRAVMVLIHRRTVSDAFGRDAVFTGGAGLRAAGTARSAVNNTADAARKRGDTTISVCQIYRAIARVRTRDFPWDRGGLRELARLRRRLTARTRWIGS